MNLIEGRCKIQSNIITHICNNKHYYEYYKAKYTSTIALSCSEYSSLIAYMNDYIMYAMIDKGIEFHTPIGTFSIVKSIINTNKLRVDWKETKEKGEKCYHTNKHSSNYYCKFLWYRNIKIHTIKLFSYKPMVDHKRYLSKKLQTETSFVNKFPIIKPKINKKK